jgi:hypothetical protein
MHQLGSNVLVNLPNREQLAPIAASSGAVSSGCIYIVNFATLQRISGIVITKNKKLIPSNEIMRNVSTVCAGSTMHGGA